MTGEPHNRSLCSFVPRSDDEGRVVARFVTFNAKRDPMFRDQDGNGWVPVARFDELMDALREIVKQSSYPNGDITCAARVCKIAKGALNE